MKAQQLLRQLATRTWRQLLRHEVQWAGAPLLAAVSGGRDSTLLARVLAELCRDGRLTVPVILGHVNHGVRPDSAQGTATVTEQARQLGLEFCSMQLNLGPLRPSEEQMRDARYEALCDMARFRGARTILTAHHADDNLETILFRMLRGSGPRGLAGIPEIRPVAEDLMVLRPFLNTRARELEQVLRGCAKIDGQALPRFEDETNADTTYTRNWLRHEVLPTLRDRLGNSLDVSLFALARSAKATANVLQAQAGRMLREHARFVADWRCEFRLADDGEASELPFLQEALIQTHMRVHGRGLMPPWSWVMRACELLTKPAGKRLGGPPVAGALLVERTHYGLLIVDPARAGLPPSSADAIELPLDDELRFGSSEWQLTTRTHSQPPLSPSPIEAGRQRALLDPRAARGGPWRLRTRRPGDRFWPLGRAQDCELNRFLSARRVPRFDRDRLPLVVDAQDRVLWVPGVEIAEPVKIRLDTEQCVELRVQVRP